MSSDLYRREAAKVRESMNYVTDPAMFQQLREIANQYDLLAEHAERRERERRKAPDSSQQI